MYIHLHTRVVYMHIFVYYMNISWRDTQETGNIGCLREENLETGEEMRGKLFKVPLFNLLNFETFIHQVNKYTVIKTLK